MEERGRVNFQEIAAGYSPKPLSAVIPAEAGIQCLPSLLTPCDQSRWIPASAGMTVKGMVVSTNPRRPSPHWDST